MGINLVKLKKLVLHLYINPWKLIIQFVVVKNELACLILRFPCNIQPYHETNPEIVSEEKFEKTGKNDCLKNVGKILLRGHSQPHLQIQKQNEKVKKKKERKKFLVMQK